MTRALDERLRVVAVPGEAEACERARRVIDAAFAARTPRRRRRMPLAAAVAGAAVVVAAGLTSPAIGQWVHALVRPGPPVVEHVRPTLGPLPGHGRLLVTAPSGAWILQADGTRRRLGAYTGATFSPGGLFVAAARGNLLAAVDPQGRVRWTLTRPERVTRPSWSPDGFRVAYRSGGELRVVYGDGALDRRLVRGSAAVTPAWRPGPAHRLALVEPGGRAVALRDTDTGALLWRTRVGGRVRGLAWSPDGRRLLAVTPGAVVAVTARGRVARTLRAPGARAVAWLPGGRRFAVVRSGPLRSEVTIGSRTLLAVPARLSGMLASPDGRWLILAAPDSGQWLLVRTSGTGHLNALSQVGRQFDPGGSGRAALPRLVGWIR